MIICLYMEFTARFARVLSKVQVTDTGCWEWLGGRWGPNRTYGQMRWNGHSINAHRAFYMILVGPIPPAKVLDHLCRNTICVNPKHLEPVTNRENILRGIGITAFRAKQTHCKNGHQLSLNNLMKTDTGRNCKTCNSDRAAKWRAAHPTYMTEYNKANWRKYAKTRPKLAA